MKLWDQIKTQFIHRPVALCGLVLIALGSWAIYLDEPMAEYATSIEDDYLLLSIGVVTLAYAIWKGR